MLNFMSKVYVILNKTVSKTYRGSVCLNMYRQIFNYCSVYCSDTSLVVTQQTHARDKT